MPQKYYKIVAVLKNKSKVSVIHEDLPPNMKVKYKLGRWTKPKYARSKLFVFGDLLHAKYFAAAGDECDIYECEIKGMEEGKTRLNVSNFLCATNIRNFWQGKGISLGEVRPVQNGTILASAVKLTKKVNLTFDQ